MRDPNRIPKVLEIIGLYWMKYPDLRLGQIIGNVSSIPYYLEDDDLIEALEEAMREDKKDGVS